MKTHHIRRATFAAAMFLCGSFLPASAAIVSGACEINGVNVCDAGTPTITPSGVLTIRGYAFDMDTQDRPSDPASGFVVVRNDESLTAYRIPIQRVEFRPDVVADHITGDFTPADYHVLNAGFIAQVFSASLPAGPYTIQEVRIAMRKGSMLSLPMDRPELRGKFILTDADSESTLKLVHSGGTETMLKMSRTASGAVVATGYPSLRDGPMEIRAAVTAGTNTIQRSVAFNYKRPVLNVGVSLPIAESFPGMSSRLMPMNPLNNRALDVAALPVVVDSETADGMMLNGQMVTKDAAFELPNTPSLAGSYRAVIQDSTETEGARDVRMWVNLPDAQNIVLRTATWNPASKIRVTQSHTSMAVKVQDADVQAKLENGSKENCSTLNTVRPGYMLSQTAGVNCAIQFGDLPEGMKYNPYASNALHGSVPVVGDNKITYTPGVVYTDPATRQTTFYKAKSGASVVNIVGTTPVPIALSFKNDKMLDTFYAKNAAQFPGKYFATVDKANTRALGMVNVKGGHRDIVTRVTYPGDRVKEFNSSIPESNVPLLLQAQTPWVESTVKVESWYRRAPEYKSEQIYDFIGVPATPLVDLAKEFASHDKADTIIKGVVGVSRGQSLLFDRAAMGEWQVTLKEDKTNASLSAPVVVDNQGVFEVNLGTRVRQLSA
jgi:hypothetical protein